MTRTEFLAQFPEFEAVSSSLVDTMLAAAALEIHSATWGTLADQGQGYLAAHKLALSPYGQQARMVAKDGTTTYQKHYESLVRIVGSGPIVP